MKRFVMGTLWLVFAFAPMGAVAGKGKPVEMTQSQLAAERYRLEGEIERLAQKTSWEGVERIYDKMLDLGLPLSTSTHYTAALAAENRGDILASWQRLERALRKSNLSAASEDEALQRIIRSLPESIDESAESTVAATAAYANLVAAYGRVAITVDSERLPVLIRMGAKPFSKSERQCIAMAQASLSADYGYAGLLPAGRYMVDGHVFTLEAGEDETVSVAERTP